MTGVRMVDVSGKPVTVRVARASAQLRLSAEAARLLAEGGLPKGDALAAARVAGVLAAKRTPELIPLCHPIALHAVDVDCAVAEQTVQVSAVVRTADRTGVEMEALTAAGVAALTVIDMVKGVDPAVAVTSLRLEEKSGGASGRWIRSG